MTGVVGDVTGAPPVALRETCRVVAGRIPLWPYHRARLEAGGCVEDALEQAEEAALAAAADWAGSESVRVRLSLTVGEDGEASVAVAQRLSSLDVPGGPTVVRIDVDEPRPLPPGAAKPADRSWWDDAQRRAVAAGAHQAILVGPDGCIIDGGTATVWIVEGPRLATPPAPPAVAGVARAFVLRSAPDDRIEFAVEPVTWERFERADEAFLTNALGGVAAVRGRVGPAYARVVNRFEEMWHSAE